MKRLSARQRLLIGALLIAGLIAAADRLTRGGAPTPARAGQTAQTAPPAAPAGWNDVNALVARLTQTDYASVAGELEQLQRDVFVPTTAAGPMFSAADPAPSAASPEPPPVEPQVDFRDKHRLSGVMLGETPLAVIDDQLLALDAEVDGFTLVGIERDYVVFLQPGSELRVVLELAQRPKNP
jgi:hypothetical protein